MKNKLIYAAQPHRLVPFLIRDLRSIYKNHEEISIEFYKQNSFGSIYLDNKQEFLPFEKMASYFIPYSNKIDIYNLRFSKNTNFFCGLLNPDKVKREIDQNIITFISDPVQRVYQMFYFIKNIYDGKTVLRVDKKIIEFFEPKFSEFTLEKFIDEFIKKEGYIVKSGISLCENMLRQFKEIDDINFIGVWELIDESFLLLKERLNIKLDSLIYKNSRFVYPKFSYREDDLKKILYNDIKIYNKIKHEHILDNI